MKENVILVDKNDNEIGLMPKLEAHLSGELHRAFSIFIFNTKGELLLQQRAEDKYHSGGKWTNTCCSHPRSGETTLAAAHRRLMEEMGLTSNLNYAFQFIYRAELAHGLIEHELDHVFFGITDDKPNFVETEVQAIKYIDMMSLKEDLISNENQYTAWLKICFNQVLTHYNNVFNYGNFN